VRVRDYPITLDKHLDRLPELTMASARPYVGEHQELHLVLAGPGWMERWGLDRRLQVGEAIEAVGYLDAEGGHDLRPVVFWLQVARGSGSSSRPSRSSRKPAPAR
jgi:hypothetical protein